jgi:hypothetical protein
MRRVIITIGLAVLMIGFGKTTQADWVTIQVEGMVDRVEDYGNYLGGKVIVGSKMTGWYTYDTSVPDTEPWEKVGHYPQNNSPAGIHFEIEGFSFNSNHNALDFHLDITNDNAAYLGDYQDVYQFRSYGNMPFIEGVPINFIGMELLDYSGNALSSDALPTMAPNLDLWQWNGLDIISDRKFGIGAHITSAIPEPGSLALLIIGTLSLYSRKTTKDSK